MYKFDFVAPRSPEDAVAQLRERGPGGKLLAGGTDLLLQTKARVTKPAYVVDLSHLPELERLEHHRGEGLWIGAMARARAIQLSPLFQDGFSIVADGAGLIGSIQIRNLATVGGNLCNAAPSADVAPPLIAANARAEIVGPDGTRTVPLDEFFLGPRRTVLGPADLLLGVRVPEPAPRSGGHYLRHTPRQEMDIAVVGVGSAITLDDERCLEVRIALGAVAPTPIRARSAEAALRGQKVTPNLIEHAARLAAEEARPISDVRGSATFRRHLVEVLTRRTLTVAWNKARQGGTGR
ncbi:MAG: FAD binding domain-containing protein [Chloroflexota bacterium]